MQCTYVRIVKVFQILTFDPFGFMFAEVHSMAKMGRDK